MKRIYITLGILLIGMIAMAYLYFSNLNTETSANDLSLNTVASNSGIIFSFENDKSFYEILSGQDLFQHILGENKSKQFSALRENLIGQPDIANALNGQKIYIGLIPGADHTIDFLIGTQIDANVNPQKIFNGLSGSQIKVNKLGEVYQLTFKDSTQCFIGLKNSMITLSNVLLPIQNALKDQKIEKQDFVNYIKNNSRFNKNTLASLYLDFNKIPLFLKSILNSNINGELNVFNKQNSFAALSYNFSKEKLLFNGNTQINDDQSYYKLFDHVPEQKLTINTILPQKTANYTIYAISDYANWHKELNELMVKTNEDKKVSQLISSVNQKYRIDLNQIFPKYFKNELVTFQLSSGEKFGAIALSNGEKVGQLLMDLSGDYAPEIKIFKEPGIAYAYFGEPFKKFEKPFYTIIDNYLVMASNASSIQVFLNSYENNALLTNDGDYQDFSNQLSSSATISFYVNHKNSNDIFGKNLKQPYFKQYQSKTGFKSFDAFAYQLSGDKGKFLSNLLLYKKPEKTVATDTLKKDF